MSTRLDPTHLALLLLAPAVTSCGATKVHGLQSHDSFTPRAAYVGEFVVGGVTSTVKDLSPEDRRYFARVLKREFRDETDFQIGSMDQVSRALGDDRHMEMLDEYRATGGVDPAWLEELDGALEARYLILARIEENRVEKEREMETIVHKEGEARTYTSMTSRSVTVELAIHDLDERRLVWTGVVQKSDMHWDSDSCDTGASLAEVLLGGGHASYPPYPKAPTTTSLMKDAFEGFAENLPSVD